MRKPQMTLSPGAIVLALLLAGPSAGNAQEGAVTGTGVVVLKKQPEVLRVHVELLAKGKDLKDALAKLKTRQTAVRSQLAALEATAGSADFGEVQVASEKTDRQAQMERMLRQRMGARGKKTAKSTQAPPVLVSARLKADFPLKAGTAEELLIKAHELQEKIKAADLGGTKEAEKLTPQEEELAEEMKEMASMSGEEGPKRGEPTFLFVSKVSDQERAKAMAKAFQKARREAAQLARAAGAELGVLRQLTNQNSAAFDPEERGYMNSQMYYYAMQQARMSDAGSEESPGEAVGVQPGKTSLRIQVSASFGLKTAAGK